MNRRVDPIHFFNSRGLNFETIDALKEEIIRLTKENEQLEDKLDRTRRRLTYLFGQNEADLLELEGRE